MVGVMDDRGEGSHNEGEDTVKVFRNLLGGAVMGRYNRMARITVFGSAWDADDEV